MEETTDRSERVRSVVTSLHPRHSCFSLSSYSRVVNRACARGAIATTKEQAKARMSFAHSDKQPFFLQLVTLFVHRHALSLLYFV